MAPADLDAAAAAKLGLCLAAVLVLPGLAALGLAGHRSRGANRLALAVGASVALWPLAILWTTLAGWVWTPATYRAFLALALVVAVGTTLLNRRRPAPGDVDVPPRAATLALGAILMIAVALRLAHVGGVVVPPWVDGLHHTLIAQLFIDHGSVPPDFRPFLAVEPFYYHFGFHALAAAVAWLAGAGVTDAVLWTGQALNAAAVLSVYALARRLTVRAPAAVLAASVPAALYWFPSYFVTWGRYTQLAGLVALPAVWILVADACAVRRPVRGQLLAAASAAGLLLVHYRVFAFFLIGAVLLAAYAPPSLTAPGARAARLARVAAIGVAGGALVAPWLVRNFASGVRTLAASSPTWYRGSAETVETVSQVQDWLWTQGTNGFWIRLAIAGTAVALARRSPAALGVALASGLAALAVWPHVLGLPTSWMLPPFSLAISLFLPVAIGVGLLYDVVAESLMAESKGTGTIGAGSTGSGTIGTESPGAEPVVAPWLAPLLTSGPRHTLLAVTALALIVAGAWEARGEVSPLAGAGWSLVAQAAGIAFLIVAGRGSPRPDGAGPPRPGRYAEAAALAAIVALAGAGAWRMREVINPGTLIALPADLPAAAWVRANTPPEARFLVSTAHWHLGTYRGIDGGYWLPILAGRETSIPAALYGYGRPEDVEAISAIAKVAERGDDLADAELSDLMDRAGAGYVYVGPAAADNASKLSAARLRRHPGLVEVYAEDGAHVFKRR